MAGRADDPVGFWLWVLKAIKSADGGLKEVLPFYTDADVRALSNIQMAAIDTKPRTPAVARAN